jgi:RNA polymerase subunit RPABC4/transcription elongation factor Spt4
MQIRFFCQNGHLLQTSEQHSGRETKCPKCHVSVTVPERRRRSHLTDSQAVRILGSHSPQRRTVPIAPASTSRLRLTDRTCPKCRNVIDTGSRICPYCNIYFGAVE